jgi:hypothetical protein
MRRRVPKSAAANGLRSGIGQLAQSEPESTRLSPLSISEAQLCPTSAPFKLTAELPMTPAFLCCQPDELAFSKVDFKPLEIQFRNCLATNTAFNFAKPDKLCVGGSKLNLQAEAVGARDVDAGGARKPFPVESSQFNWVPRCYSTLTCKNSTHVAASENANLARNSVVSHRGSPLAQGSLGH